MNTVVPTWTRATGSGPRTFASAARRPVSTSAVVGTFAVATIRPALSRTASVFVPPTSIPTTLRIGRQRTPSEFRVARGRAGWAIEGAYNRAILVRTDSEAVRRIHEVFCRLDDFTAS